MSNVDMFVQPPIYRLLTSSFELLEMEFPGQTLVDVLILVLASTYTIFATVHIMLLWHMRNNFFIVLR